MHAHVVFQGHCGAQWLVQSGSVCSSGASEHAAADPPSKVACSAMCFMQGHIFFLPVHSVPCFPRPPCVQAYISQLKLEGLALTSDMVYVTQSGERAHSWRHKQPDWPGRGAVNASAPILVRIVAALHER